MKTRKTFYEEIALTSSGDISYKVLSDSSIEIVNKNRSNFRCDDNCFTCPNKDYC